MKHNMAGCSPLLLALFRLRWRSTCWSQL
jgi:hypothetical protein